MRKTVITGANKGIGLALVSAILEHAEDTFVFLGSRDAGRGAAARESLLADHPSWADRVEVLEIDVADDASVASAAERVKGSLGEGETLHGLVNNAGVGFTVSDMRTVLGVNTLGMRRVSEAFAPLLASPGGRLVNVTSASGPNFIAKCGAERQGAMTSPDVEWAYVESVMEEALAIADDGGDFDAAGLGDGNSYGLSKACANAYTLVLAREHPELRVNACTPGFIETDLTRPYAEKAGRSAEEMGMKQPKEGTRSPMFLLFGEPEGSGRYYGSDAVRSPLDRYRAPGDPPFEG
jgi:NAD(P)-dependent dehydrogenase (short-subunit alcohol dehydrogenase family)